MLALPGYEGYKLKYIITNNTNFKLEELSRYKIGRLLWATNRSQEASAENQKYWVMSAGLIRLRAIINQQSTWEVFGSTNLYRYLITPHSDTINHVWLGRPINKYGVNRLRLILLRKIERCRWWRWKADLGGTMRGTAQWRPPPCEEQQQWRPPPTPLPIPFSTHGAASSSGPMLFFSGVLLRSLVVLHLPSSFQLYSGFIAQTNVVK